ncbi:flagellar motor stator protein MotA [Bacillus subtilis]|uniref:Motility protein A n=3 Tax=Bacillus subtilis subsp. subtilis TaxID=135461 RepID=MOTA_BACSU|nr:MULTISPECIES: flagellar motor stator protein MotA [Bacillales]NP_389252.1 motility protein A; MotA component of the H+-coupled stator flagellum complex [Bacillus subtilis subsp. subtilis str. 168]P28611.1 RecName: Full=Motility protein A; AltName: Full=Chemotaxis protein MotA [Bacillus subtilis subsp. subtilis str. 168]6YSL_C Chain C, Motility protein A [Bacillus subtilis subsp. subtilis str. 168]6YSL_D Chain D, Motility protein A [Bacillus subtilis subsp. subtilis str. 168]6YSL_E Chain E, 
MDKTSLIGIILAFVALSVGMVLKGVSFSALANPAAILIIIAGTISAVVIAFPTKEIKKVPTLFRVLFKENKQLTIEELIPMFSEWAQLARREGLLALEASIEDVDDAFLKNGLSMAVDGQSAEFIRDIMTEEVEAMEDRHQAGAAIFTQAGTYAPTLGVLGAVIGLIAALSHMDNTDELGHAISAAFVATLLGIFTGYVLWHPFANKLKRKSKQEVKLREVMIEGVLSVLEGQAPKVIEQKLLMYLPAKDRLKFAEQGEAQNGEKKEEEA